MRCYTREEAIKQIAAGGFPLKNSYEPDIARKGWFSASVRLELSAPRAFKIAQHLVYAIRPWENCMLLVSASGIFSTDSDLFLYYRLRQSLGDFQLLHEAPGHYFHGFETNELESIVFLGILAGWDMYAIPSPAYAAWFITHDEFIDISFSNEEALQEFNKWFEPAQ